MKDIAPTETVSIDRFLDALAAISGVSRRRLERVLFQGRSEPPPHGKQRRTKRLPAKPMRSN